MPVDAYPCKCKAKPITIGLQMDGYTSARHTMSAQAIGNRPHRGLRIALGQAQTDIEHSLELIAKLDQVKRIPSDVGEKGVVKANL